jgi:hypothetical protein
MDSAVTTMGDPSRDASTNALDTRHRIVRW